MPIPRKNLISLEISSFYHCISRCARSAFLCGQDPKTGASYEHRRGWIEERIDLLASVFAIGVGAYAILHNHFHIVLHINMPQVFTWTDKEVCERWHKVYKGTPLTHKYMLNENNLDESERLAVQAKLDEWRHRLSSISWFMRALNEPIARKANIEDKCSGAFWQSRFTSQALLTEKALAACLAYVDLNPIRAGIAETPENSDYTSIKKRITALQNSDPQPKNLDTFVGNPRNDMPQGLPFVLEEYIELVDWSGRIIREDKRGSIDQRLPPILERLEIKPATWKKLSLEFEDQFKHFVGSSSKVKAAATVMGYKHAPGISSCRDFFG